MTRVDSKKRRTPGISQGCDEVTKNEDMQPEGRNGRHEQDGRGWLV